MKTRTKLLTLISLLCLTMALFMVGVWALKTVDFTVGGNLSYVAPGVEATISKGILTNGVWENAGDATNKMPQTEITKSDTEQTLTTKFSYWQNLNLQFNEAGDDVTIAFTITNNASNKSIAINVSTSYASATNCTIAVDATSTMLEPQASHTFTLTMTVTDKTENATMTNFAVVFNIQLTETVKDASEYSTLVFAVTNETSKTCSVTQNTNNMPTGDVEIPEYVKINGEAYAVTSVLGSYESYLGFGMNRNITSVSLPMTMKDVLHYAFLGCSSLTNVYVQGAVDFGTSAFLGTAVQYNVYDNASYLGSKTNPYLVLMSVSSKSITSLIIHEDCCIVNGALNGGALANLTALTSIVIPEKLRTIGYYAFYKSTSLKSITFGSRVQNIGRYAFADCTGLTSITIPNSVTSIEMGAFSGCTNLSVVNVEATTPPAIGDDSFLNCSSSLIIYVPTESLSSYLSSSDWSTYATKIQGKTF